jgi:hypothetical protein
MGKRNEKCSVASRGSVKGKASLSAKGSLSAALLSEKAKACAKSAVSVAALSDRDAGWAKRVDKARTGLREVESVLAKLGSARRRTAAQKQQLALEERKLAVMESRSEREQWAFDREERRRNFKGYTREQLNRLRMQVFGLPPIPEPAPALTSTGGEQGPTQTQNGGQNES